MKFSIPRLILLTVLSLELSAQSADTVKYISLEPYDFHLSWLRDDNAMLIDVREFFEYKRSRIKDAVLISPSGNMEFAADTLDKELALFLYCTTDYRSIRLAAKFAEKGFRAVYNLEGGIKAWRKDGFPVERKKMRKREGVKR